jgi:hypothetical protein
MSMYRAAKALDMVRRRKKPMTGTSPGKLNVTPGRLATIHRDMTMKAAGSTGTTRCTERHADGTLDLRSAPFDRPICATRPIAKRAK